MWLLLRLLVAAGLAIDAYVHFDLAPTYDAVKATGSPHLSQGLLFRIEGVAAVVAALLVLAVRARWTALLAFVVAAGGVGAVLLYRYVDVGALGPLPPMYEPMWYTEKTLSAIAEGVAAVVALAAAFWPTQGRMGVGRRGGRDALLPHGR